MRKFAMLILASVVIVAGSVAWYHAALRPVNADDAVRMPVQIAKGSSTSFIADQLAGEGVVRSSLAFRLHTRFSGKEQRIQAGGFLLSPAMSAPEVLTVLTGAGGGEQVVTVPEGDTVKDIDALLAEKGW